MKLAFVGYGKMGRMMDALASGYGFEVVLRLDEFNNVDGAGMTRENFAGVDVAIEFTAPEAAIGNIEALAGLGVNTVVGTTGWSRHLDRARAAVEKAGTALVYASNFSVGVNVFERVAAETARLMAAQPEYEAWAWEIHHSAKKDAPSGTLLTLVESMRRAGYERKIDQAASRAGAHPGTHEIGFDSAADTITLRHTARSREGFARGALHAARWIVGRKGVYEFREVLFGAR
ncbi:MAG: dihydrodipicolinate reductase [Bryobacterales bacterium]|nr:dihydrodipicolinate reductase [Bryobacterales bacterium]